MSWADEMDYEQDGSEVEAEAEAEASVMKNGELVVEAGDETQARSSFNTLFSSRHLSLALPLRFRSLVPLLGRGLPIFGPAKYTVRSLFTNIAAASIPLLFPRRIAILLQLLVEGALHFQRRNKNNKLPTAEILPRIFSTTAYHCNALNFQLNPSVASVVSSTIDYVSSFKRNNIFMNDG
jgi:hypothetical protein